MTQHISALVHWFKHTLRGLSISLISEFPSAGLIQNCLSPLSSIRSPFAQCPSLFFLSFLFIFCLPSRACLLTSATVFSPLRHWIGIAGILPSRLFSSELDTLFSGFPWLPWCSLMVWWILNYYCSPRALSTVTDWLVYPLLPFNVFYIQVKSHLHKETLPEYPELYSLYRFQS